MKAYQCNICGSFAVKNTVKDAIPYRSLGTWRCPNRCEHNGHSIIKVVRQESKAAKA